MSMKRSSQRGAERPQAAALRRTREDHTQETAQDYAEAIQDLAGRDGGTRVADLARRLGVSHVTVIRTLDRLRERRLVAPPGDSGVRLTPAGVRLATESRRRHAVVVAFLEAIGVSKGVAEADAEGLEHHVSRETLRAMGRFLSRSGNGSV